ncbi:hypothetical protein, partial [Alteromonas oceani]|uniref:hypothetical protein n=1 Tax=Alteromonas oceani TaxID=2071609 RepID=UPI0019D05753
VIYGPTRFASDFDIVINKIIAFIYSAWLQGDSSPLALMQFAVTQLIIPTASLFEPMTGIVFK